MEQPQRKSVVCNFSCPPDLWDKIADWSKRADVSKSQFIRDAIYEHAHRLGFDEKPKTKGWHTK